MVPLLRPPIFLDPAVTPWVRSNVSAPSRGRTLHELDVVGEEGWELVAVIYNPVLYGVVLYFKRRFSHMDKRNWAEE